MANSPEARALKAPSRESLDLSRGVFTIDAYPDSAEDMGSVAAYNSQGNKLNQNQGTQGG